MLERKMIDHDHFTFKTKGFLTYENQKRGSEWYQVCVKRTLLNISNS